MRIGRQFILALAAAVLTVAGLLTLAAPGASATASRAATPAGTIFYDQGTPYGNYMNLWGGGPSVRDYNAVTYNDYIQVVWIAAGQFELVDEVSGGADCIGDYGGAYGNARAGTSFCPTTGSGGWGTIFKVGPSCGNGFVKYKNVHWDAYIGIPGSDGAAVYLNTSGSCIKQMDPPR